MPSAPARLTIAPETVLRFEGDLERLFPCPRAGGDPASVERQRGPRLRGDKGALGIAVSGGPDSLALLLLAHAARPDSIAAATVDHGFRPDATVEAAHVAAICAELGVPHTILRAEPVEAGSLQMRARAMRYHALSDWARADGLAAVLTAHHADDQAETLLMRLNRGAGTGGLSGIRAAVEIKGITVLRPLLGWRRAELAAIVADARIEPVDDASNRDPRHDRTAARALLAREPWLDPARLARSAAALGEAEVALAYAADQAWADRATSTAEGVSVDPRGLPRELRRRLLVRALAALGDSDARGDAIDRLLTALDRGEQATLGAVLARPAAHGWLLCLAPPRRTA